MIGDEDELAGREVGIDATRRVRHDERADPESSEDPDTERDPVGSDPLVQVRPPAHDRHRHAVERAEHEDARVPDRRRDGPVGDLGVRNLDAVLELVREPAEPASEDDADARLDRDLLANEPDGVVQAHVEPSATRRSYSDTTSSTASAGTSARSIPA